MGGPEDVRDLLLGPRGRRLCLELLPERPAMLGWPLPVSLHLPSGLRTDLEAAVVAALPAIDVFAGLAESVNWAMYWQEPDETDRMLDHPEVKELLEPVALAVTHAPAAAWWASPLARDDQQYVQFLGEPQRPPPSLSGSPAMLNAWRTSTAAAEARALTGPGDPTAPVTGSWWSTPADAGVVTTTRALPGLGAAGLALLEDSWGPTTARCWPLAAQPGARCYEITGSEDWVELVTRYPLDVTGSRRHDWWRVTGWADGWLIPDWADVATDYDAVHLTVAGYLSSAGRTLRVGQEATLLAGWNPDQTFWLNDVLRDAGPTTLWRSDGNPTHWTVVA
ncbi:MAG: hypothetical protein ABI775_03615 [Pseudonocardiales bacterium]|nr:hypothetical protein [Actinomycetota bacterium]